ncbi:MAG: TonB-dependent receptor, partial [Alphaproteobacteria bacterium]
MLSPSKPSARRRTLALSLVSITCFTLPVTAAAADAASSVSLPPLVVTPTRLPTPENEVGSSITVISEEEIQRKQERTLPDALKDVPGLNVVQTGGPGGVTSVFIRGANSNQTKVFIDGIDATNPATGTFNFEHILTWDIERVEVVRGPQSGLYGADAIGGVINIITKKGSGPARLVRYFEPERSDERIFRTVQLLFGFCSLSHERYPSNAARLDPDGAAGARGLVRQQDILREVRCRSRRQFRP